MWGVFTGKTEQQHQRGTGQHARRGKVQSKFWGAGVIREVFLPQLSTTPHAVLSSESANEDLAWRRLQIRGHTRQNQPFTKPPFYLPVLFWVFFVYRFSFWNSRLFGPI